MREHVPVVEESNEHIEHHHDGSIEGKWDPTIKHADFGKRHPVYIITYNFALLAALNHFHDRIDPWKHNHEQQTEEHQLDKTEVEPHRFVYLGDLAVDGLGVAEGIFEQLMAARAVVWVGLSVAAESCGLLMHYAHLEIGWDFESPKFARFHRVGCVLLGDRLIDVFIIGYEMICFSGRLDIERCASFHPTIIITNIIPKTNNPSIPSTLYHIQYNITQRYPCTHPPKYGWSTARSHYTWTSIHSPSSCRSCWSQPITRTYRTMTLSTARTDSSASTPSTAR